jgi:hypothetical protein
LQQVRQPQAGFEPTTFRLLSECSTPKLLWHLMKRQGKVHYHSPHRNRPYGPMDKAPAYGAGDSGFESQYGLKNTFCNHHVSPSSRTVLLRRTFSHTSSNIKKETRGDARIELATSCTRSRNHTTRPITRVCSIKRRDVLELNQRPIGLQPIALPLS